ncbi:MAG: Hha toxicity modulator TomB [Candidatus Erwinia impunctatus]|nr:Hha toxicity modulator TomB [Culicoides impunctatus]
MDEYSLKKHDQAELKYLCEMLYRCAYSIYNESVGNGINNPTYDYHMQLNELIDHVSAFMMLYKIKHQNDAHLTNEIEFYIDNTFSIFGMEIIELSEFIHWKNIASNILVQLNQ